jgi:hypothetical protein
MWSTDIPSSTCADQVGCLVLVTCEPIAPAAVPEGAAMRCIRDASENPVGIECCGECVIPRAGLEAVLSRRFPATAPLDPVACGRSALGDERTHVTVHVLTGKPPCMTGKPRL